MGSFPLRPRLRSRTDSRSSRSPSDADAERFRTDPGRRGRGTCPERCELRTSWGGAPRPWATGELPAPAEGWSLRHPRPPFPRLLGQPPGAYPRPAGPALALRSEPSRQCHPWAPRNLRYDEMIRPGWPAGLQSPAGIHEPPQTPRGESPDAPDRHPIQS